MEAGIAFSHGGLVTKDLAKTEQCQLGKSRSRHKHCGGLVVDTGFAVGDRQEGRLNTESRKKSFRHCVQTSSHYQADPTRRKGSILTGR